MLDFSPSLPQSILILPNRLKYSDPLYKTEDKFSISTEECLTFQTVFHSLSNTPRQTETLRTPSQVRIQILAPHHGLPDFQADFPALPTTSPAEPLPTSFLPHYQCISPALEDTSSPASHFPKTSPLAPHSLLP